MVTANLWRDMCNGAFCKVTSTVQFKGMMFPLASVLWVCFDEDRDDDCDTPFPVLSVLARNILGRFDILKRRGITRMNKISIGGVVDGDDEFLEGNVDGHIGQQIHRIHEVATVLSLVNDSSEHHMFNALKSAPHLANIQYLDITGRTFKLGDIVNLVAALPNLVSMSCAVGGIGPEIEVIPDNKRPSSLRTRHYPLSNNFRKLRVFDSSAIPAQDIAYVSMLLAVMCPKFGHVDLSSKLRYTFNRKIAWAIINDPFRPYSSSLEHGTPKFDVESPAKKRNEYAALCKVLVGDWSRGVRSQVPGRGLWSVNTKYT
ncbi:hypothetical protein H4S03_005924, partial [Coemansia sp. S3946]